MRRNRAPTISDLAQHLGVHKSTVSRAMDPERRHLIGADLLQRVDAAAREIGYRPNRVAAALTTGRSGTIGVLLLGFTNPSLSSLLRGITAALGADGYIALLASTSTNQGDINSPEAVVERLLEYRVDGFIVTSAALVAPWLDRLRASHRHVVLVNRTDGGSSLPAVVNDDRLGMKLAVDYLVGLGHRRIAHLAAPGNLSTGRDRRAGFESAMAEHGLVAGPIVECADFRMESGMTGMAQLLDDWRPPRGKRSSPLPATAVVGAADLIALGALRTLKERGIAVPAQMSVIGHNDTPLLDQTDPPLTTIRVQYCEMGFRAGRRLVKSIKGEADLGASTTLLTPELVIRASTAPPAAR